MNNTSKKQDEKKEPTSAAKESEPKSSEVKTASSKTTSPDSAEIEPTLNTLKDSSKPKKKHTSKRSPSSLNTFIIFLISISAAGLAAYDYGLLHLQKNLNQEAMKQRDDSESRIVQMQQELRTLQQKLAAEINARVNLQTEQQAANAAVQDISEKIGRSSVAWRMAEVEYLLTVANHRLTLAQDRATAIAVFQTADSRLQAIADPSLLNVRKKVASEIAALRAVANVDVPGIAVQLGGMAESVEQLPLIDKVRVQAAIEKAEVKSELEWDEIPQAMWNDVKSLVVVRRHQKATEPLLPPSEAWFLYQNLQLKLQQARLFALQKNTALFVQALNEVSSWLKAYFDEESMAVIAMQASLDKLKQIELRPAIPDVSGSLRELRAVMNNRAELKLSATAENKTAKESGQ